MPTTEACARCAEPNASQTKSPSHSAASSFANASLFFSSSGWNRTFSRTRTSPSTSALLCDSTPGPTQSNADATGRPSNSSNFFAAGCSEYFDSGPPLGRPRCEASTSLPPFSMASFNVGSVSRMRVSSVTKPSFSGTLKSTRMKTRLPRKSRSLIVSLSIYALVQNLAMILFRVGCDALRPASAKRKYLSVVSLPQTRNFRLEFCCEQLDQVTASAGIAPLIVVPGQNFYALVANHLGVFRVHDGRIRVAFEVRRHQLLFRVCQDSLQWPVSGRLQRRVHGFLRRRLLNENRQIDDTHVRRRDPHRVTIQFAF